MAVQTSVMGMTNESLSFYDDIRPTSYNANINKTCRLSENYIKSSVLAHEFRCSYNSLTYIKCYITIIVVNYGTLGERVNAEVKFYLKPNTSLYGLSISHKSRTAVAQSG